MGDIKAHCGVVNCPKAIEALEMKMELANSISEITRHEQSDKEDKVNALKTELKALKCY